MRFARLQGWRVGFVRPLGESADPTLSHLRHHPSPPHPPTQASLLATSLPRPPPPCRAEAVVPSPASWPSQESSGRGPGAKADREPWSAFLTSRATSLALVCLLGTPAFVVPRACDPSPSLRRARGTVSQYQYSQDPLLGLIGYQEGLTPTNGSEVWGKFPAVSRASLSL